MGLRDRVTAGTTQLARSAGSSAINAVKSRDRASGRLIALVEDDDGPVTIESLLVSLVQAVRDDDETAEGLSDRDIIKAAKRRQKRLGAVGLVAGPVGTYVVSLYCEVAILCDVVELHRLNMSDEDIAAHLLVLWNAVPDYDAARVAIDGTGQSVGARIKGHLSDARDEVWVNPAEQTTRKAQLMALWRMRSLDAVAARLDSTVEELGDALPGSARVRDVLLPGRRVKQFKRAAEQEVNVA